MMSFEAVRAHLAGADVIASCLRLRVKILEYGELLGQDLQDSSEFASRSGRSTFLPPAPRSE